MQLDREITNISHNGLIIPFYIYPFDQTKNDFVPEFYKVIEMAKYNADVVVIVNPESGPGSVYDEAYNQAIKKFYSAGIRVIGYVATNQGNKDEKIVKYEVSLYFTRYPYLSGIFLDEFPDTINYEKYIYSIITYINRFRKKDLQVNPGTVIEEDLYLKLVNKVSGFIFYENAGFIENAFLENVYKFYNRIKSAYISHSVPSLPDANTIKRIQKYFKYVQFSSTSYNSIDDYMLDYCNNYIKI